MKVWARRVLPLFAVLSLIGRSTAQDTPPAAPSSALVALPTTVDPAVDERIRRLEADNRQIMELCKSLVKQNEDLAKRLDSAYTPGPTNANGSATSGTGTESGGDSEGLSRRAARGVGAQGTGGRTFPVESETEGSDKPKKQRAIVDFGEGLEFSSADEEFKIQFHDMTQAEYRFFPNSNNNSFLKSQFFVPSQRWYFTGYVTKNIEFYTSVNRGYGTYDLLDAFLTFRYDNRLRLRIGRMKTPYLYEYYQIAEGDLIAPERSLYAINFAGNRQDGAMVLGELFNNHMGYSVGVFDGARRSFGDTNGAKDLFVFLNSRPFLKTDDDGTSPGSGGNAAPNRPNQNIQSELGGTRERGLLEYLNLGGSFNIGYEQNPLQPSILTTANDQSSPASNSVVQSLSPTFFAFNNNVVEQGMRAQWSAHAVWFHKSLMLLAEYGGGYAGYAFANRSSSTRVPFQGFTVGPSYFVTGEQLTRRVNIVVPKSPFRVRNGKPSGTGAVEVYARYAYLDMGKNVFSAGFADPNSWTNQASTIDIGANWYFNFYTKIYFDWQHSIYGSPVQTGTGTFGRSQDLLWMRFQLFF